MIKKLNKDSYLNMSINELENRLEMQAIQPGVGTQDTSCDDFCNTWNKGAVCNSTYIQT